MMAACEWYGTQVEGFELQTALSHNCACEFTDSILTNRCEAHRAFVEDQRFLNGLVFARRIRTRLLEEEDCAKAE